MAHLTKEERQEKRALEAARNAELETARLAEMPMTLLTLLARAGSAFVHTSVSMVNDVVTIEYTDKYRDNYTLTLKSSESDVDRFTWVVADAEDEQRRARIREELRTSARAKLTAEELEALGL